MFFGSFNIGATAQCLCTVENASGAATVSDALPTFRVYGGSATPVATGTTSAFDTGNLTGVYLVSFTVTGGFARGSNYQVVVSYNVSSQLREKVFSLSIS